MIILLLEVVFNLKLRKSEKENFKKIKIKILTPAAQTSRTFCATG